MPYNHENTLSLRQVYRRSGIFMAATQKTNVEMMEQLYTAFNQGDIETVLDGMAADITWIEPEGSEVFGGEYHGPEAVLEHVFAPTNEDYDRFEVRPDRFIDGGDTVVVEGVFTIAITAGNDFEIPFVQVVDLKDGKIQHFRNYADTAVFNQQHTA